MIKEYKIASGWATFIYIGGPLLIALFGWALMMLFQTQSKIPFAILIFCAAACIGMVLLAVVGILDAMNGKFVIDHDRIYLRTSFTKRELKFDQILGYHVTEKDILIRPNTAEGKIIKVSTYFGKSHEILEWLVTLVTLISIS